MKKSALLLTIFSMAAATGVANTPFVSKVYEFMPAPGQFVHSVPALTDDMTPEQVLAEVERQIAGDERPGMISLGAFGGYVIFGFDHPLVNVAGECDLKIYGNAFKADMAHSDGGSCEPGIVMVSVDANKNGLPDDEWFELRGSAHDDAETIGNFTITYKRPSQTETAEDILWTSDSDKHPSGTVSANQFHKQSYWPGWAAKGETLTFTGTRLPDNGHDESGDGTYWVLDFFEWGYADNLPDYVNDPATGMLVANPENPGFDLSNAIDSEGNAVTLGHVDFVKVYTGVNQECGWIGETSTEICGARDLHPDAVEAGLSDAVTDNAGATLRLSGRTLMVGTDKPEAVEVFDASGRLAARFDAAVGHNALSLDRLAQGVYIVRAGSAAMRIALR